MCCCYCRCSATAALLQLLRAAAVLFRCCCCCSPRSSPQGRPEIYYDVHFLLVRHRAPLPRLLCQGQPRACMMCYCCCFCCRCSAAARELLLYMCCCRAVLLLLLCPRYVFAADPGEHGYYASQPFSVMCLRNLKAERRTHLLRMLCEYRLAVDIYLTSRRRSRARVVFV